MEAVADAAYGEALQRRLEHAHDPLWRLVADAQQDRGRCGDRLVSADAGDDRQDRRHGIARPAHDQKADGRVPEADHVPGQGDGEQDDQQLIFAW